MADQGQVETRRRWRDRILIAACAGLIVAVISILAAYAEQTFGEGQRTTCFGLHDVEKAIRAFQEEHYLLPDSPADLKGHDLSWVYSGSEKDGNLVDGWGRPLVWKRDGNHIVVTSLGRDGKPGGIGVDYDLSTAELKDFPREAHMTFYQFLFESQTAAFMTISLFSGLLTFALTLFMARKQGPQAGALSLKIILTIVGACVVAWVEATLQHVGH